MARFCSNTVNTTCPYCGVGCGVKVTTIDGVVTVEGDKLHPASHGKLCSKGYALPDTLYDNNRLLQPMISGANVTWDKAIGRIASEFQSLVETHGPDSIAFYVSGQLLTEDYYAVNKFVKGFLGTANIDTNSRLCMASSVAGHKRAFGSDTVPGCYEDLEHADVVVLVGSNFAWCHPVLFQRLQKAKDKNPLLQIVTIDPRSTATAQQSDVHLPVNAGGESDAVLFLGLLHYLNINDSLNSEWIRAHTNNAAVALAEAANWPINAVAEFTGLTQKQVRHFYGLYTGKKVMTVYSQGVNQSHRGTDTVNSIINVHLATGSIGKQGSGPFSITGQPNAMGGREVGGLANMLACHMDIENETHRNLVQRYWNSPSIANAPGLKAIDLFEGVKSRQIKALWVMATNPADSMPKANSVLDAIANCPFVVVSDVTQQTDTAELATVLLPARAWSEKDGTVTNSERRISRQRAFRKAAGQAQPDWWAVSKVAQRMGFEREFDYQHAADIFKEYAGLSGFENLGSRDFDISAHKGITQAEYDALTPFQWPLVNLEQAKSSRLFADGRFFTPDGKARFVPVAIERGVLAAGVAEVPGVGGDSTYLNSQLSARNADALKKEQDSLLLNTGRIRDQWHTMTRTGFSARLSAHLGEPFVEIHPADASRLNIKDAVIVELSSEQGTIQLRALITDRVKPGTVFVPMHWTNHYASNARVNVLVHAICDPVSGQPALKNQRVTLAPSALNSFGFMVSRTKPTTLNYDYWACTPVEFGWKTEFASSMTPEELEKVVCNSTTETVDGANVFKFSDGSRSQYRFCWFAENTLCSAVFVSSEPVLVARQAISSLLGHTYVSQTEKLSVLSAAGLSTKKDVGTTICSCMQVGVKTIQGAIDAGCDSIQSVGDACGAGTQCGSCRVDILRLLAEVRKPEKDGALAANTA